MLQLTNLIGDRVRNARNLASQGERIMENGPASHATGHSRRSDGLAQYDATIGAYRQASVLLNQRTAAVDAVAEEVTGRIDIETEYEQFFDAPAKIDKICKERGIL